MADDDNTQTHQQAPEPNPTLESLDVIVGTWGLKGRESGHDEENDNLRSYFFSNEGPGPFGRVALEYVWEVGDDALTIWGGYVGSPASFQGKFSDDRDTITGRWEWPGGGYEATM